MTFDDRVEQIINQSLETTVRLYKDMRFSSKGLERFVAQFGNVQNPHDFIQGYFMGDLQGIAFATARCTLGREMNEDERNRLAEMIKSKAPIVEDIVKTIRSVKNFGF